MIHQDGGKKLNQLIVHCVFRGFGYSMFYNPVSLLAVFLYSAEWGELVLAPVKAILALEIWMSKYWGEGGKSGDVKISKVSCFIEHKQGEAGASSRSSNSERVIILPKVALYVEILSYYEHIMRDLSLLL